MGNVIFKDDLLADEEIVWTGQPETSVILTRGDALLIPFSLCWAGATITAAMAVVASHKLNEISPILVDLWVIIFGFMMFYFLIGRFIYKNIRKQHTYYAITNKRILIACTLFNKYFQQERIGFVSGIKLIAEQRGLGTIIFGASVSTAMYGNTGMEFFDPGHTKPVLAFYDIKNVQQVYDTVSKIKKELELNSPNKPLY